MNKINYCIKCCNPKKHFCFLLFHNVVAYDKQIVKDAEFKY
jgi:hypothetical protein